MEFKIEGPLFNEAVTKVCAALRKEPQRPAEGVIEIRADQANGLEFRSLNYQLFDFTIRLFESPEIIEEGVFYIQVNTIKRLCSTIANLPVIVCKVEDNQLTITAAQLGTIRGDLYSDPQSFTSMIIAAENSREVIAKNDLIIKALKLATSSAHKDSPILIKTLDHSICIYTLYAEGGSCRYEISLSSDLELPEFKGYFESRVIRAALLEDIATFSTFEKGIILFTDDFRCIVFKRDNYTENQMQEGDVFLNHPVLTQHQIDVKALLDAYHFQCFGAEPGSVLKVSSGHNHICLKGPGTQSQAQVDSMLMKSTSGHVLDTGLSLNNFQAAVNCLGKKNGGCVDIIEYEVGDNNQIISLQLDYDSKHLDTPYTLEASSFLVPPGLLNY